MNDRLRCLIDRSHRQRPPKRETRTSDRAYGCTAGIEGPVTSATQLVEHVLRASPRLVSALGPPPAGATEQAEERLGLIFPPSYRALVTTFGAIELDGRLIYGVGSSLATVDGLNVVWHTELARAHQALPLDQLVLSSWDDLTLEVMRVTDGSGNSVDGPIREYTVEGWGELLAPTLSDWLALKIQEMHEDVGQ